MSIRKHLLLVVFGVLCFVAGTLIFVNRVQAEGLPFSLAPGGASGAVEVTAVDAWTGEPLPDAQVSRAPGAIVVRHPGYAWVGVLGAESGALLVRLKPLPREDARSMFRGKLTGWRTGVPRDRVQGGAVFSAIGAGDLVDFSVSSFLSPLRDTIDVLGPRQIPSNVVLPDQRISIIFDSIRLNKPEYRLPLDSRREQRLAGVFGEIRVVDAMPGLQGNASIELLNSLKLTRVGLGAPVTASPGETLVDLTTTFELTPQASVTPEKAPFAADVLVAALTDMKGDRSVLLPTDVKVAATAGSSAAPRTHRLVSTASGVGVSRGVLAVATSGRGERLTGVIAEVGQASQVRTGPFLPVDLLPALVRNEVPAEVRIQAPDHGLAAVVAQGADGALGTVYALPSAGQVTVPIRDLLGAERASGYSVVRLEFDATRFDERQIDGELVLQSLRRFTRAQAKAVAGGAVR